MPDKTFLSVHCLFGEIVHIGAAMYKNEETSEPSCLRCGAPVYGRTDKKFCSDKCRRDFHNLSSNGLRSLRRAAMRSLDANYRILEQFVLMGMESVPLESARAIGFDPDAHSWSKKKGRGHTLYRCYDIEYVLTASRILKLKKVNP